MKQTSTKPPAPDNSPPGVVLLVVEFLTPDLVI